MREIALASLVMEPANENERALLAALAWMCQQYLGDMESRELDHLCMTAGERAIDLLVDYGLVEPHGRGGRWTAAGEALLRVS